MSGSVFPSPCPFSGSLLVAETRLGWIVPGGEQASTTSAVTCTSHILWLGGQRDDGSTLTFSSGGIVSATVITTSSVAEAPALSVTRSVTVEAPVGRVTFAVAPVATTEPFRSHSKVVMSSLVPAVESGSVDWLPSSATGVPSGELHSTVRSEPAFATGGWFGRMTRMVIGAD